MFRFLIAGIALFTLCTQMAVAQEAIVHPPMTDPRTYACYELLCKKGLDYQTVCCYDSNPTVAYDCAYKKVPAGYRVRTETFHDDCTGIKCDAAVTTVASPHHSPCQQPTVKVTIYCCGCNGVFFRAIGDGATYCEALEDAIATAYSVVNAECMGGLKCYSLCPPGSSPKHHGILRRILGR